MRRGILRPGDVDDSAGFGIAYPVNAANKQKAFWRWRYRGPTIFNDPALIGNDGEYRDSGGLTGGADRVVAFFYTAQEAWSFDFATYDISATNDEGDASAQINIITFLPPVLSDTTEIFSDAASGAGAVNVSGSFATAVFPATDSPLGVLIAYKNSGESGSYSVQFDVQAIPS